MKLITTTQYVDMLNKEIDDLRKQLKENGIIPVTTSDYVSLAKRERKGEKKIISDAARRLLRVVKQQIIRKKRNKYFNKSH